MSRSPGKLDVKKRVIQAVGLAAVFALLFGATHLVSQSNSGSDVVAGLGLLLLAGILLSELCELVGLPHLSGYLLAGMLAGPHILHVVDHATVERLSLVNTLALSLIALAGGAELRIHDLRSGIKSLFWSLAIHSTFGFLAMAVVFVALSRWLPFTQSLSFSAVIGVGLLWGVVSITRSPSATLGIISQVRPQGPITRFSLPFVMSSDVVVVLLLALMVGLVRPLIDAGSDFSFDSLAALAHEIVGSVALGTTLGLLLAAYLRLVGGRLLLVLIAIGYGMTEGLHYLHFDPLLSFLIAGFVVQNMSQQGEKLLHGIEQMAAVVFVVFFATAGAHLDLALLRAVWPVALALALSRGLVAWLGNRFATRLAGDAPAVRRWGWTSLVSQAGLTLGIGTTIQRAFPEVGSGFGALVVATVAINEMVGPVLFKVVLDRTGESGRAGQPSLTEAREAAVEATKAS